MKVIQLYKNNNELINKAAKGNREAQNRLYNIHAPKMLSVCRYYISDVQHAEEAMLNGFYKAFINLKKFEDKGSFEGWLRKIMVRESISFLRSQKNVEFFEEDMATQNSYENNIQSNLEVAAIQQLIDNLPSGYRMVFVMYAVEGYKHHEIADLLDISEGTSKSQLFKARQILQQQVKELNNQNYGTN
ncbi:RNA polymerase subunit sigma-70 [Hanstruepera neustonica]|uniref:RNA polymerase subunit sigma-70 n=1 Tax=Hanstruepera neustonica TaxID=1445657 RepID=A0A2K1E1D0_9FLAO|nr:RNA polymerase subunit sigma-70 [Hanstruepera neustonica]